MLGFTKKETMVIIFLVSGFICGSGIQYVQRKWSPLPEPVNAVPVSTGNTAVAQQKPLIEQEENLFNHEIQLNTASSDLLQQIPGIGPVTARNIIQYRDQNGPFQSVEDLIQVKGIGPKTIKKIKSYLTVKNNH